MSKIFGFFLFSALALSTGCAMIKKLTCNANVAQHNAQNDVKEGRTDQPGIRSGDSCDGEYSKSQFAQDYNRAYEDAVKSTCINENAAKVGFADGESGNNERPQLKQFTSCAKLKNYRQLESIYQAEFLKAYCSDSRAKKLGDESGTKMENPNFEQKFSSCDTNQKNKLSSIYESSYKTSYNQAVKNKTDEFIKNTGTAGFTFEGRAYSASCRVVPDKGSLQVTVNNPHPQKTLVQGNWKFTYYDKGLQRLMDDTSQEAVLLINSNPKTFAKFTMPRDAEFCRAEFIGQ